MLIVNSISLTSYALGSCGSFVHHGLHCRSGFISYTTSEQDVQEFNNTEKTSLALHNGGQV